MKIHLDVGCGSNKQRGFMGMDRRDLPGVDIVHDAEVFPWPLDDESCAVIVMSHFIEHVKPWFSIDMVNECWRVLELGGALLISTPYAGSFRYFQDPTHCNPWNAATPAYFDPENGLYQVYRPKPWTVEKLYYQVSGDLEVAMTKRGTDGTETV
jgi:predicted SAM-dependent methyltransferase